MTMMRLLILTALMFFAGCSTIGPPVVSKDYDLATLKTAYVVRHAKSNRNIDVYIQSALVEHGVTASSGPLENKPKGVDFYVTYDDRWQWDMAIYLGSLDISFIDNKTGHLIASGHFKNGIFHSFPNPSEEVKKVISSVYKR